MKKTTKQPKRLLLSTETVRKLQPLSDRQLQGVAGGRFTSTTDGGDTTTDTGACPYSIVKPE